MGTHVASNCVPPQQDGVGIVPSFQASSPGLSPTLPLPSPRPIPAPMFSTGRRLVSWSLLGPEQLFGGLLGLAQLFSLSGCSVSALNSRLPLAPHGSGAVAQRHLGGSLGDTCGWPHLLGPPCPARLHCLLGSGFSLIFR